MEQNTISQFQEEFKACREIFENKIKDYGTAWRILRPSSVTDQLFIKAQRIRTIQEKGAMKVDEGIEPEFQGLVNYAVIGLIQLELGWVEDTEMDLTQALQKFDAKQREVEDLMLNKNHDYGEAWRDMRINSLTDLILMKIHRIKQIEDNEGKTLISEGISSHYSDIINYSVFALIKISEQNEGITLDL